MNNIVKRNICYLKYIFHYDLVEANTLVPFWVHAHLSVSLCYLVRFHIVNVHVLNRWRNAHLAYWNIILVPWLISNINKRLPTQQLLWIKQKRVDRFICWRFQVLHTLSYTERLIHKMQKALLQCLMNCAYKRRHSF